MGIPLSMHRSIRRESRRCLSKSGSSTVLMPARPGVEEMTLKERAPLSLALQVGRIRPSRENVPTRHKRRLLLIA
jgi:hypothetical protein